MVKESKESIAGERDVLQFGKMKLQECKKSAALH